MTTVQQQLALDGMDCIAGNVPMKLCHDDGGSLAPHLLAISSEIDGFDDLPDVGSVLERSGILDTAADGGTPNSLKSFDMSDFAVEDGTDDLPFDGILDLSDRTSSVLPQNLLPPSGGMFCSNGHVSQPMPFLTSFPLESVVQKQDLVVLGTPNPFSSNLLAAPHVVINNGIISTVCTRQSFVKPDGSSKFVSSILSGSDDNRKLGTRTHSGKNKSGDGSALTFPNDRDAPEYQRVMDILTEYRVQVAEKSAEALMPCKRRKSRPLVDVVEVAKSVGASTNQSGVLSSKQCSPGACVPLLALQQHGLMTELPGDLSGSDSVASNGSAVDLPRAPEQNTAGISSANYIVNQKPVMGRALDIAVSQTVDSQGLSLDKVNFIPSSSRLKELTFQYTNPPFAVSSSGKSIANSSPDEPSEISCEKGLEPIPECHCAEAGRCILWSM